MTPTNWREVLANLAPANRAHCGPDMADAYRRLAKSYPNCDVLAYSSGGASWQKPPGWTLRRATLTDPAGQVIADSNDSPLQVFIYSPPFNGTVTRDELEPHLFSNPDQPDRIPFHFRNQYRFWEPQWGFCLPDSVRSNLPEGDYQVEIDTAFDESAPLEQVVQTHKGELADTLLFVSHFDHPAQTCDGLLGCLAGHEALTRMGDRETHLTYRMLSSVEIVGSVFYAHQHAGQHGIQEAMVTAVAGAKAPLVYSTSVRNQAFVDRAMRHLLLHAEEDSREVPFRGAMGNDETAFDVAGVDIPCGSLMRWPFAEYHTDADNPSAVDEDLFEAFVQLIARLIDIAENNAVLTPRFTGLPCLANPEVDLYLSPAQISQMDAGDDPTAERLMAKLPDACARQQAKTYAGSFNQLMTLLPALADGTITTLGLSERCGLPFVLVDAYTDMWVDAGLLAKEWVNPFSDAGRNV